MGVSFVGDNIVVVRHAGLSADTAKQLCDDIRARVRNTPGMVTIVHDATDMRSADKAYRDHFLELEREIGAKVERTICYIPAALPRILARTVAAMSGRQWEIFKDEASFRRAFEAAVRGERRA